MTINRLVRSASLGLLILVTVSGLVFLAAVLTIRIGGPLESRIVRGAALEADILPPPLFVVEPYAVAMEGFLHEEKRAHAVVRLRQLESDYRARRDYWRGQDLQPDVRASLDRVEAQADLFWGVLHQRALPVMISGDQARFDATFEALAAAYNAQRVEIARLIEMTGRANAKVRTEADTALWISALLLGGLALLLLGGVIGFAALLRRRVVTPLSELTDAAKSLSAGKQTDVPHLGRGDELGDLAGAFDHFVHIAAERDAVQRQTVAKEKELVGELAAILIRISQGDLHTVASASFDGDYAVLGENLNTAIATLRSMIENVHVGANSIQLAASEIAAASDDLSNRTQSSAAAIEQTTVALTDVDRRVTSTRDAAHSTAQSAERARAAVERGLAKARSAAATMEEVRGAAASVDGVMEALDKIAFQTRVLAMNAAVEAGHAGEVGKGFAVVADLVSQLAARAEEEARNAREQLTATAERIAEAVEGVSEVEVQFSEIVSDVVTVTELVDRLSNDAKAQAHAVAEIAAAMQQMDLSTQQNAAMVEETSAAAANLLGDAGSLVHHTQQFHWDRGEEVRHSPANRSRAPYAMAA